MSDHRAGNDRLSDLLAAAAAPARDHELAGEQAAVAAFRSARLATAPQRRRPRMLTLLTAKTAVAAAAAFGGIALAAAAGALPGQQHEDPVPTTGTSVAATSTTTVPRANPPEQKPDATPAPSLKGQCQAYTAGAGAEHGKARENPAFRALAEAAGGEDHIPAFCADLLGDKPGKPDHGKPARPNR